MKKPGGAERKARLQAIAEDLEYYRTKRLEPRLLHFVRKGILPLPDLLRAGAATSAKPKSSGSRARNWDVEDRISALERGLNDYIGGIGVIAWGLVDDVDFVVEDQRKEAGSYDDFFKVAKRRYPQDLEGCLTSLERNLKNDLAVLDSFTRALVRKGLVPKDALGSRGKGSPAPTQANGAKIVARAWAEPTFKARLMTKGREALSEIGLPAGGVGRLGVLEDTDRVHNVVVCTLCSCYPYDLLGNPPWWYKHDVYKERIVADPRPTLKEMFGFSVPTSTEVRVYDSTSDIRYMVIPRRPPGTEGLGEEELARLVTPESLLGTGEAMRPRPAATRAPAKPKSQAQRGP